MFQNFKNSCRNSQWYLVGTNIIVVSVRFIICFKIITNAYFFSSLIEYIICIFNFSGILLSSSMFINLYSLIPVFINCANCWGIVAEKSKTCLEGGQALKISTNCSSKFNSNNLSASSIVKISTLFKERLPSL